MYGIPLPPSLQQSLDETKVEYTQVGSSGLRVSWPILGALSFGTPQPVAPWLLNEVASMEVLKAAYDRGINTWDTSNVYSNGQSEEIIGKAIQKFNIPREMVVIMTKCGFHVGEERDVIGAAFADQMNQSKDYVNQGGLTRPGILYQVEQSLARLGTTYIDLLQIQRFDLLTPPEETMKALHDLVESGKVRYIGASSMWAYTVCPLFAGRLGRPVGDESSTRSKRPSYHHSSVTEADKSIIRRVEILANEKGWNMSHVALAWLKSKGVVPIVGCTSVARIDDMGALKGKTLTDEEVKYLEEPYEARPVAGHF